MRRFSRLSIYNWKISYLFQVKSEKDISRLLTRGERDLVTTSQPSPLIRWSTRNSYSNFVSIFIISAAGRPLLETFGQKARLDAACSQRFPADFSRSSVYLVDVILCACQCVVSIPELCGPNFVSLCVPIMLIESPCRYRNHDSMIIVLIS